MNRRNFLFAAAAALPMVGTSALAQRNTGASTIITTLLTSSEIDYSGADVEPETPFIDDANGSEHVHFEGEGFQVLCVCFWPHSAGDSAAYVQSLGEMALSVLPGAETIASGETESGGWVATNGDMVRYYEYQFDAYPGHDLIIEFDAEPATFATALENVQGIKVDGMPPLLFLDDSDILVAVNEIPVESSTNVGGTSTTTQSEASKVTRTTRETNSSSANGTEGGADSNAADAVVQHREEFFASYDRFLSDLDVVSAENATDIEVHDGFDAMLAEASAWIMYPTTAADVTFGNTETSLKEAYMYWCECVADMGTTFQAVVLEAGSVDIFINAQETWILADKDLLGVLGISAIRHRTSRIRSGLARMHNVQSMLPSANPCSGRRDDDPLCKPKKKKEE